jgi:hypothetical protein
MRNLQKGFIIPLTAVIIILLIGSGFYLIKKNKIVEMNLGSKVPVNAIDGIKTVQGVISNSAVDSDWKTYTNEKYGFELRYPEKYGKINTSTFINDDGTTYYRKTDDRYRLFSNGPFYIKTQKINQPFSSVRGKGLEIWFDVDANKFIEKDEATPSFETIAPTDKDSLIISTKDIPVYTDSCPGEDMADFSCTDYHVVLLDKRTMLDIFVSEEDYIAKSVLSSLKFTIKNNLTTE